MQIRSGSSSQWGPTGPCVILACGEMGYDSTNKVLKVGDGVTCWEDLPPIAGGENNADAEHRNIILNAYIWDAEFVGVYNGITKTVTYTVTLYGNSSYYDLTFSYVPSTSPSNHTYAVTNNNTIYNNLWATGPQPPLSHPHYTFTTTFPFNTPPPQGVYNVTLAISTANAGGIGKGSTKSILGTLQIGQADDMGNPSISINPAPTPTQGTGVVVSGVTYYGLNSLVTFAARTLTLNNIYKTISNYGMPPLFNYLTINDSAPSASRTDSTTNLEYGATSPYSLFPAASGVNATYYNRASVGFRLNGTNVPAGSSIATGVYLTYSLLNALSKTATERMYPESGSVLIGYINAWSSTKETIIPKNQAGYTTILGIDSQQRMSISNAQTTGQLFPNISNIVPFDNTILTNYDPAYNPFDGLFYAKGDLSDDPAPGSIQYSLKNYILPTQTISFSGTTKYLVIRLTNSAPLRAFTLHLQNSGTDLTGVTGVSVYWKDTPNSKTYGWYDASTDWLLTGGCQNGYSGNAYIWQIKINVAATDYYNPSASGGNIYINIRFTGQINLNQIAIV